MSTTQPRREGRVAAILNATELVISLGKEQGVKKGMRFAVLGEPLEIKVPADPADSTKVVVLGDLKREKTRVVAVVVQERLAICRLYRQDPSMRFMARYRRRNRLKEAFSIGEKQKISSYSYGARCVRVGDQVESLPEKS